MSGNAIDRRDAWRQQRQTKGARRNGGDMFQLHKFKLNRELAIKHDKKSCSVG